MLQITENEILEAFDKFELSEEEMLSYYQNGYISENTMDQLIEMGVFDEFLVEEELSEEELEEGKITRGIREVGHQIVKHFIQPRLAKNYKRDAYAHELKHVRRQLNDARKEGDQKAIEKLKNRAASIRKKGDNAGHGYVYNDFQRLMYDTPDGRSRIQNRFSTYNSSKGNNLVHTKYDVDKNKILNKYGLDSNTYKPLNKESGIKSELVPHNNTVFYDKHFRRGNIDKLAQYVHGSKDPIRYKLN